MCLPQCSSKQELCEKCKVQLSKPDESTVVQCDHCGTVLGVYTNKKEINGRIVLLPRFLYSQGCRDCSGIEFERKYLNLVLE